MKDEKQLIQEVDDLLWNSPTLAKDIVHLVKQMKKDIYILTLQVEKIEEITKEKLSEQLEELHVLESHQSSSHNK